jgi:hypothetical protein
MFFSCLCDGEERLAGWMVGGFDNFFSSHGIGKNAARLLSFFVKQMNNDHVSF